jgi:hypothetical protein
VAPAVDSGRLIGRRKPVKRLAHLRGIRKRFGRAAAAFMAPPGALPPVEEGRVRILAQKVAPLRLAVRERERRVNLLVPTIDLRHVFGGYIAKLNLARRLSEAGLRVRVVIVDDCDFRPAVWRRDLEAFQGLAGLLDRVELAYAFDRRFSLPVSRDDTFIATTWWTAHLAHRAAEELGRERFVYLIQEYEPFTFPMGAFAAFAAESYTFPHYAVFSTDLLREHFRKNEIGVYREGSRAGDEMSISFENAITTAGPVQAAELAGRTPKRLLFYARPEAHAARNMFELGILALSDAIHRRVFGADWEFHGIGSLGRPERVPLAHERLLMSPRRSQEEYGHALRAHDVGVSLMFTPHPSLVPIEMAAAGMIVVTNTFGVKTAERLGAISSNLIGAEPTLDGVRKGLEAAVDRVHDYESRVLGANVRWSTSWNTSFSDAVLEAVTRFLERTAPRSDVAPVGAS